MNEYVTVDIDEKGNVTVEGHNFTGDACVKLTAEIERALGEVERRNFKPDYRRTRSVVRKAGA